MTTATAPSVVSDLQATLVELIELSLVGKQAHWNVVGPNFRSVHLQLDEVVDLARLQADRVAERIATIGEVPEGRSRPVADTSDLPPFPDGTVSVEATVATITEIMDVISDRTRERILRVGDDDPVSQDILIAGADALEKAAWMLRAQLA